MPIFDPASLQQAIAAQLHAADLGNAKNAFVAVVTRNAQGEVVVRGAVTRKINDVWTVSAVVAIDHQANIEGGLEVKAAW